MIYSVHQSLDIDKKGFDFWEVIGQPNIEKVCMPGHTGDS